MRKYLVMTRYFFGGGATFQAMPSCQTFMTFNRNDPLQPYEEPLDAVKLFDSGKISASLDIHFNPVRVRNLDEAGNLVRAIANYHDLSSSIAAIRQPNGPYKSQSVNGAITLAREIKTKGQLPYLEKILRTNRRYLSFLSKPEDEIVARLKALQQRS
jgi:hypothetical protein